MKPQKVKTCAGIIFFRGNRIMYMLTQKAKL